MSQPKKQIITLQLPRPLVDRLDKMAIRLDKSRNWIVKQVVLDWLAREDKKDKLTQKALKDIETGNIIDHNKIIAWAKRLK